MISYPGDFFAATAHLEARFSSYLHISFASRTSAKFTCGISLLMENSLLMKKPKPDESLVKNK